VPHGHWKTTTFVAGLRLTGLVAPFVLDGPINRDAFEVYAEKVLVPELSPGDVVVMDNLSSHKGPKVRSLIEEAGAVLLYLPTYSPDFNPIEGQIESIAPEGCRADRRGPLEGDRPAYRHLHAARVRQLLRRGRVRPDVIGFRSNAPLVAPT
jgi:hypothetical protein